MIFHCDTRGLTLLVISSKMSLVHSTGGQKKGHKKAPQMSYMQFFDYNFTCPCSIIYFANVCVQHLLQSGDILSIEFYAKWSYYIDREKQKTQPQKDI